MKVPVNPSELPDMIQTILYFKMAKIRFTIKSLSYGSDAAIRMVKVASVSSDNLLIPLTYKPLFLSMK